MYKCGCGKEIGLMANGKGEPEMFKCPYTNRVQQPQTPLRRKVPASKPLED